MINTELSYNFMEYHAVHAISEESDTVDFTADVNHQKKTTNFIPINVIKCRIVLS